MSSRVRPSASSMAPLARSSGYRLNRSIKPFIRSRLKISCLITCSRLSSSPATVGRTKPSATGRSTSTIAVARNMSGRNSANEMAAAITAAKTPNARTRRRRTMSTARRTGDSSEELVIARAFRLRNDDDVAGTNEEVVLAVAVSDFGIVERNARGAVAVLPQHDDAVAPGELGEPLRQRDALEHGRRALEHETPRRLDGADHGDLQALHFRNDHRHFSRRHEFSEPLG